MAIEAGERRRSDIVRLAVGSVIGTIGDEMGYLALGYLVYRKTGSPMWLAASLILTMGVSGLLSFIGGPLADRLNRKRIIVVAELFAGLCFGLMAVVDEPFLLLLLAFGASAMGPFIFPAFMAAIPNLAPEDRLQWANGILSAAHNISRLAGPFLMGALLGVIDPIWMFVFNALTYVISACLVASIGRSFEDTDAREAAEPTGPLEGFRVIRANRVLLSLTAGWFLVTIAINVVIVTDIPYSDQFGMGAFGYGALYGLFGGGAVVGALIATKLTKRSEWWALLLETVVTAVGYLLVGFIPWFGIALITMGAVGMADAIGSVAGLSLVQRTTDDTVRGRVFAAFGSVWPFANIIGFLVAGPLLVATSPQSVYVFGGVVGILSTIAMWPAVRTLRRMRDDPDPEAETELPSGTPPQPDTEPAAPLRSP